MRTNAPREPSPNRARPQPEYRTLPDGKKVPVYRCRLCADMGLVSLPRRKDAESAEYLLGLVSGIPGMHQKPGYAWPCPGCSPAYARLSYAHQTRLARWRDLMLSLFEQQQALPVERPRVDWPRIAKPIPDLSGFEQDEIAAQMRREAQA